MRAALLSVTLGLVWAASMPPPAGAWMHAGRFGTASGGGGS